MIKNAMAYVMRKKNRTLIVFIILTLVLSCLYSCLSVMKSSSSLEDFLYRSSNSSLSIYRKDNGYFDLGQFKSLNKIDEVKELVSQYDSLAKPTNVGVVEGKQAVQRDSLPEEFKNVLAMEANSSTSRNILFTSGSFTIKEGRHIEKDDRGKILVHRDFAKKNKLKLNDIIGLKLLQTGKPDSDLAYNFKIVGIFSGKKQEKYTGLSSDFSENMVFVDYSSSQKAINKSSSNGLVNKLGIFLDKPSMTKKVVNKLKKLDIDWSNYKLEKDTKAFDETLESLSGVRHIIKIMTYSIMVGAVIVLSLILVLWLRERLYEIGILLSIGVGKVIIVGQFILELILISIPASIVSFILGNVLIERLMDGLIQPDVSSNLADSLISRLGKLEAILNFLQTYGILVLIIVVSVLIASIMILIRKPKEILSKIS
nr:ABC transporter permease [uncultured Peptostreptococcus sp.]